MSDLKQKILSLVRDDLEDIESALRHNLRPYLQIVSRVASHLLFSGGKRLRPLLFILSARMCGYSDEEGMKLSSVFEYLHTATLLHDDIVDGAKIRRGKQVANSIWGSPTAVLVGDFLLARSSSLAVDSGNLEVVRVLSEVSENMSQGEIQQIMRKGDMTISEPEYMEVIQRKTAVLFQGACRIGAIVAKAIKEKEADLSDYGFHLGMAFQMVDDLIDYTSDTRTMGKEIGADLKEGKLTLPVIYALKKADTGDRREMEKIITQKAFSDQDFDRLLEMLRRYGGIAYTQMQAAEQVGKAKEALSSFHSSSTKDALLMIADYTLERNA